MIRPIILADYHQTRRHILLAALLLSSIALAARLIGGVVGIFFAVMLLLPSVSPGLGAGTFAEEFAKGHFKFLYALPVSRPGIWAVKWLSGLLQTLLFTSCICIPLFSFPDATLREVYDLLRQLEVPLLSFGVLLVIWSLYGYAVGMLCVMMCASLQGTAFVGLAGGYLPVGVFYLLYLVKHTFPSPRGATLVLAAGAVTFFVGSLVSFMIRNPFVERKWLWRGVGSGFIGLATLVLAVSAAATTLWPRATSPGRFDRVIAAHPSPDGRRLAVVTQAPMLQTHGYVLTAGGTIEFDLGARVRLLDRPEVTWCPAKDKAIVAYAEVESLLYGIRRGAAEKPRSKLLLKNLETGQLTHLPLLDYYQREMEWSDYRELSFYRGWSMEGRWLLGWKHMFKKGFRESLCIFGQDVTTGQLTEMLLREGVYRYAHFIPDGRVVAVIDSGESEQTETAVMADLERGTQQEFSLPADGIDWRALPNSRSLILVRKLFDGGGVNHEVLLYDLETGATEILVDRAELPNATLEQASRGQEGWVSTKLSPSSRWLLCTASEYQAKGPNKQTRQLIYLSQRMRIDLPPTEMEEVTAEMVFANDDSKLLVVPRLDSDGEEEEDKSAVQDSHPAPKDVRLRVLALSTEGVQEVFSLNVPASIDEFEWLGNSKIVYLRCLDEDAGGSALLVGRWQDQLKHALFWRQELWVIDLDTGSHQPLRPDLADRRGQ